MITRQDLTPGYQVVQSCHAVADFAFENPQAFKFWKEQSNSIICLATVNEESLKKIQEKLFKQNIPFSSFNEPDIENQLTSVSFFASYAQRKQFSHLPLALKKVINHE